MFTISFPNIIIISTPRVYIDQLNLIVQAVLVGVMKFADERQEARFIYNVGLAFVSWVVNPCHEGHHLIVGTYGGKFHDPYNAKVISFLLGEDVVEEVD